MTKKDVHRRILLLFACLIPVLVSTCGDGDGGGPVVTSASGRITTPDGSGVQGATVTITGASGGFGCTMPSSLTTTTDANGNYVFSSTDSSLASGTGTITPSLGGYGFAPPSRTVAINYGDAVTGQDFTATPLPHVISGRLSSAGGAALQGAIVTLGGAANATAPTDGNGQYVFAGLQNGTYTITPSIPGATFTPAILTVTVASADLTGNDFTASGYLLSGRVTVSGRAAAGVPITLAGSASSSTATDSNGRYAFVAQPGPCTITPSMTATGYAFTPGNRAITVDAADAIGLDFVMESWMISGRATSYSGGGIPGVQVSLSGTSTSSAATDGLGNFGFIVYQNGPYIITPSLSGFAFTPPARTITVDHANVSGQDFTTNAYTISGRIARDGGAGVSGVTVSLAGTASTSIETDADGSFSLIVAQDGPYTVTPATACPTFAFTPASTTVTVAADNVAGVDFAAAYLNPATYTLTGRVTTPAGAGLSGLPVGLTGAGSSTTATDADGRYGFAGLRNGSYGITPESADYVFTPAKRAPNLCNSALAGQDFTATRTWARSYSGLGHERAYAIRQTSDQGYIVAGYTTVAGLGTWDAWILRLNPNGTIVWQKSYGGAGADSISAVERTSGGYIVAGSTSSFGAGGSDAWVMKLDDDGNPVWQKAYGGASDDHAASVREIAGGGYIVAGSTSSFGAGGSDAWVMKLDADGSIVWQKTFGVAGGWDRAASIRQTADNGYVAAGSIFAHSAGTLGYYDSWVFRLDPDGNMIWQKSYGGNGDEGANSIERTADGGYIVAGATSVASSGGIGGTGDRFWVLKLDEGGNAAWQKTYGGIGGDEAKSIRQTADGGYIAAGSTYSFGTGYYNIWVLKLDPDGNIAWQTAYGTGAALDIAYSVQQTMDGGYVAAGGRDEDFLVVKVDPDGNIDGCGFGGNTTASPSATAFTPVDTDALATDATASATASAAAPEVAAAGITQICPAP